MCKKNIRRTKANETFFYMFLCTHFNTLLCAKRTSEEPKQMKGGLNTAKVVFFQNANVY
jgi:hypothetical protein